MGSEARCRTEFGKKSSLGQARLESEELVFRGEFRLAIPLKQVESAEAKQGWLAVRFPGGVARFHLGPQAQKWALKIRYPKSLIDKLGVKPGAAVAVLGITDKKFHRQLEARTAAIAEGKPKKDSDFILFGAERTDDLKRLKALRSFLKSTGTIWVVYPKGQPHIRQADVMAAAKAAGLVDVKVASFSATHTALKLVIPISQR